MNQSVVNSTSKSNNMVKKNKQMAFVSHMPRSSIASVRLQEHDQSIVTQSVADDPQPNSLAMEGKRFEKLTRQYVDNSSVLISKHQKLLTNAGFSAQGGIARRKSKASISGAVIDTGLQADDNKSNMSAISFYERKLKQKELMDQLNSLHRSEKEKAQYKECSFIPNKSPSPKQTGDHDRDTSPTQSILHNFKQIHSDIVSRPLEANILRREEAENKRILEEMLEKERHDKQCSERKSLY